MKSVLLHVADDPLFETRLQATLALVRHISGHLVCLQTRQIPPYLGADFTGFVGSASMVVQLIDEENKAIKRNREQIEARLRQEKIPFSFLDTVGQISDVITSHALLVDVIVMSLADEKNRNLANAISSTIMVADAPVLAIPPGLEQLALRKSAVLAWKPTAEAAHAIKRAVPLLKLARNVVLLSVEQESNAYAHTHVTDYLGAYGIQVEVRHERARKEDTAKVVLRVAGELDAGMIVMGGYSRSRAMEFLMGGVTRQLLQDSKTPLLMAH